MLLFSVLTLRVNQDYLFHYYRFQKNHQKIYYIIKFIYIFILIFNYLRLYVMILH